MSTTAVIVANPLAPVAAQGGQQRGGLSVQGGNALAAAVEQRAVTEIQTKHLMAVKFPRDQRAAVDRIITAFARPTLAHGAQYEYPRGNETVRGPSIRAAEAMAQSWGNMEFGFSEITRFTDDHGVGVSLIRAGAVDLETNTHRVTEFHVRHWRDTKKGGHRLTDERDVYELCANLAQRRVRASILALLPSDVVETAMRQADEAVKSTVVVTPETIKAIADAFEKMGATRKMLEGRFQRRLDTISPGQYQQLRRIFASIRDGESNVIDWFPEAATSNAEQAEGNPGAEALNQRHAPDQTQVGPGTAPLREANAQAASQAQPNPTENAERDRARQQRRPRRADPPAAEDATPAATPAPDQGATPAGDTGDSTEDQSNE